MEYRMLVVDDEEKVTQTLRSTFIKQGYNVMTANDGSEANRVINETPLDLILLDIEMPGVSGFEVLQHVKNTHPDKNPDVFINWYIIISCVNRIYWIHKWISSFRFIFFFCVLNICKIKIELKKSTVFLIFTF